MDLSTFMSIFIERRGITFIQGGKCSLLVEKDLAEHRAKIWQNQIEARKREPDREHKGKRVRNQSKPDEHEERQEVGDSQECVPFQRSHMQHLTKLMRRRIAPLAKYCQAGFVPYRHRFPLLMVSPGRDHLVGAGRSGSGGSPETKRLAVHSGMVDQRLETSPHI